MLNSQKALPALKRIALDLLVPFQWITFKWLSFKEGINHAYIKDMYARLVQLDWYEFVEIGPYQVLAFGLTAHIRKDDGYEFTISENMQKKQLYVHEKHKGVWSEVYRTNRLMADTRFVNELYFLDREIEKVADSLPENGGTTL